MLFLITEKQKKRILDDYHARLINLFSIGLFFLAIVFLICVFPTYLAMKVNRKILSDKIVPMQAEIEKYKTDSQENDSMKINDDISVLSTPHVQNTLAIYNEIKGIYHEIPNVQIVTLQVDSIAKKVSVTAVIDNKNTASALVDRLNASRYKGATLPYSVFSQSKNFTFNQNLTYE